MKILFVFCDMLRANLLKTFNENIKQNSRMDYFFNRIGGTAFSNCYTPSPDSPRSLACLYTGFYPKDNRCDTRIKWPRFYLKDDLTTVFNLLSECGFTMTVSLSKTRKQLGQLPSNLPHEIIVHHSQRDIKNAIGKNIKSMENQFFFVTLIDYHWSIDDYGANSLGDYKGQKHISNYLNGFFDDIEPDSFDYIFLFSDHGYWLNSEKNESKLFLTNDNRTKITMFVRKKGDSRVVINDKLSSIMDIFPTIQNILGMRNRFASDGISLFDKDEHNNIVIEDHKTFGVTIGQVLENWAVRTKNYFYFRNLEKNALFKVISPNKYKEVLEPDVNLINELEKEIERKSLSYVENKKQYEILKYYREMLYSKDPYADGEPRINNPRKLFYRFYGYPQKLDRAIREMLEDKYKRW